MLIQKKVGTLIGNPRPASKTTRVAQEVATRVAEALGNATVLTPVELGIHGAAVLEHPSAKVDEDRDAMADVDVLVVASPTYKATYTGLLKAFLDRYAANGLAGVVAVPVMVGGSQQHALATEVHLRPLLVELGAVVPARGLFVLDSQLDGLSETIESWLEGGSSALRAAVRAEDARP